jgi:hypothetical protein
MFRLTRRTALLSAGLVATGLVSLRPRAALAADAIGTVAEVTGEGFLIREGTEGALAPGLPVMEGDTAVTGETALALLILEEDTRISMGPAATVVLQKFLAEVGGTIEIGGAIVFDRAEDRPPVDLTFATAYGEIGVRGTRFFVGPSRGEYAVFCQRGRVSVTNAGVTRDLGPGDGVNMSEGAPSEVAQWGDARIAEAFASVGLSV